MQPLYAGNGIVAIRREDKNKWERRAPLAPEHVAALVQRGVRVVVQKSGRRCYPDGAYAAAGAEVQEDISAASTVLCVKEPPIDLLLSHPGRTWVCFSHTIKAQRSNMPLLDAFLASRQRLIDYECITETGERRGKRLVAFGRFAGLAGAVDFNRGLGERLLALGHSTPFLSTGSSYMYRSAAEAKEAVKRCGEQLADEGLPAELCPFVAAFTGGGNVAKGAKEVWFNLPHEVVTPEELPALMASCKEADKKHDDAVEAWSLATADGKAPGPSPPVPEHRRKVYMVDIGREAMVERRGQGGTGAVEGASAASSKAKIDRAHYSAHPDEYDPIFARDVLPFVSAVFICHYWEPKYPRLFTAEDCGELWRAGQLRLVGVCDVTCDYMGACDMLTTFTSIEEPFFCADVGAVGAAKKQATGGSGASGAGDDAVSLASAGAGIEVEYQGEGEGWPVAMGVDAGAKAAKGLGKGPASRWVLYHAVDHLPSELPRDSTGHFGSALVSMVEGLAWDDQNESKSLFDKPGKAQPMTSTELPAVQEVAKAPVSARKAPDGVSALSRLLVGATITCAGQLTPAYRYIAAMRNADERAARSMAKSGSDQALSRMAQGGSDGGKLQAQGDTSSVGAGVDSLQEGKGMRPVEAVRSSSIGDQLLAAAGSQPRASPLAKPPAMRVPASGQRRMARAPSYTTMSVRGHLFDNNVINKVLDVVEKNNGAANILRMEVGRDGEEESIAALQVFVQDGNKAGALTKMVEQVHSTAKELGAVVAPMAVGDAAKESAGAANRLAKFQRGGPGDGATAGWGWGLGADASGATHLVPIRADGASAVDGSRAVSTPTSLGIAVDERPGGRAAGGAMAAAAQGLPADVLSSMSPMIPKAMPREAWSRRVLLLGSGLVTAPLLDIMLQDPRNAIVVGSFDAVQAAELVARVAGGRLGLPVAPDGGSADAFAEHGRSDGDQLVGGGSAAFSHLSKDPIAGRRCAATFIDVNNQPNRLMQLVSGADVVLSLVSAPFHPPVAKACVESGVNMVTASYTSPAMKEIESDAKAKGVLLLNECGLDPGIDHATAARCVDKVRAQGGTVTEFSSVCGGLPAPEAATNPLGYKFSWAPRGVLTACKNDSAWLEGGEVRKEPGSRLLQTAKDMYVNPAFSLEVLPNRDSIAFMQTYGFAPPDGAAAGGAAGAEALAGGAKRFFRGTLRYKGYCAQAEAWRRLGWLWETDANGPDRCIGQDGSGKPTIAAPFAEASLQTDGGISLRRWLAASLGLGGDRSAEALDAVTDKEMQDALAAVCAKEPAIEPSASLRNMQWLGFFGPRVLRPPASGRLNGGVVAEAPPLDVLSHLLQTEPAMGYAVSEATGKQERDMALMRHVVRAEYPAAGGKPARKVRIDSTLIEYGSDTAGGDSAMARTVGYCSAVAAQLVLDGKLSEVTGCATPVQQAVYEPLLAGLERLGIRMEEEEHEE